MPGGRVRIVADRVSGRALRIDGHITTIDVTLGTSFDSPFSPRMIWSLLDRCFDASPSRGWRGIVDAPPVDAPAHVVRRVTAPLVPSPSDSIVVP